MLVLVGAVKMADRVVGNDGLVIIQQERKIEMKRNEVLPELLYPFVKWRSHQNFGFRPPVEKRIGRKI